MPDGGFVRLRPYTAQIRPYLRLVAIIMIML